MNILKIELASIEQTDLGFEHWVDVTYTVPILKISTRSSCYYSWNAR